MATKSSSSKTKKNERSVTRLVGLRRVTRVKPKITSPRRRKA